MYAVTGYSDGLWCIVDSTKFLGEEERRANWPMQVHEHPLIGRISPFSNKAEAQRVADLLNKGDDCIVEEVARG